MLAFRNNAYGQYLFVLQKKLTQYYKYSNLLLQFVLGKSCFKDNDCLRQRLSKWLKKEHFEYDITFYTQTQSSTLKKRFQEQFHSLYHYFF